MNTIVRKTFKHRLLEHSAVEQLIHIVHEAKTVYVSELEKLWPLYNPLFEIAALKTIISKETDVEVLKAATQRIHELQSDANKLTVDRARTLAVQQLRKFSAPIQSLLKASEAAADELIAEADAAEDEFFASWGVAIGGDTKVAEAAKKLKREIRDMKERIFRETEGGIFKIYPRPQSLSEILAWFVTPPAAPVAIVKPAPTTTTSTASVSVATAGDSDELVPNDDQE